MRVKNNLILVGLHFKFEFCYAKNIKNKQVVSRMSKDISIADDVREVEDKLESKANSGKDKKAAKKGRKRKPVDWTVIRAEYITGDMSLAQLAEKYDIAKSSIQKKSAEGRWSEQRKRKAVAESDKIVKKLTEYNAKQKIKDIAKACNAASALIDKIVEATEELRKVELINKKVKKTHKKVNKNGKLEEVDNTITSYDYKVIEGAIDTKKLSNLSKSLANCKSVLDVAESSDDGDIGVIEMPAMTVLEPPEEESEVLKGE